MILILGLSYILSIVTIYANDIQHLWNIFVHSLLFVSPIFWEVDKVGGFLLLVQQINPLGQLIEISHKLVINQTIPPLNDWLYTTSLVFAIFFIGYAFFTKFQGKIMEEL